MGSDVQSNVTEFAIEASDAGKSLTGERLKLRRYNIAKYYKQQDNHTNYHKVSNCTIQSLKFCHKNYQKKRAIICP